MSDLNFKHCQAALDNLTELFENECINEIQLSELKLKFPDCIEEIQDQYNLWKDLVKINVPVPSYKMHSRFYKSLGKLEAAEGIVKNGISSAPSTLNVSSGKVLNLWRHPWKYAIAASIFAIGILVGRGFNTNPGSYFDHSQLNNQNPASSFNYVIQKPTMTATDKLIAMQEIKAKTNPNDKIIEALYQALLNDPNINVRLTAIETLIHFADHPKAREYLIKAIPSQESALVQVALADAMLLLKEKKSAAAWNELLNSSNVEPDVKIDIAERLETLL